MGRAIGPGRRSLDLLAWLARVGASPVEPLSRALGLSQRSTYDHLFRLRARGWIERYSGLRHQHGLMAITQDGLDQVGWPRARAPRLSPSSWQHHVAEAEAAAWLSTHPHCRWWSHEREFSDQWSLRLRVGGRDFAHRPDLVAELRGDTVAVEVELSAKSRKRLGQILSAYAKAIAENQFRAVVYLVSDDAVATLVSHVRNERLATAPRLHNQIKLMNFERLPKRRLPNEAPEALGSTYDAGP